MTTGLYLQGLFGLLGLCALAWLISENRRALPWRALAAGLGLQFLLAVALLRVAPVRGAFEAVNDAVAALQAATAAGSAFVFGYVGGGAPPFEVINPNNSLVLAFQALTLIIVISALTAVLIHWRILPLLVRGFSALLQKPFGLGGAAGLGTAANIFVGMVEAPLFIRDHIARLSRSDLFVVMCGGMATIAGTVLFLYAAVIGDAVSDAAGHLLAASVISAPAAVMIARIMVPPTVAAGPEAATAAPPAYASTMDAITEGTRSGVGLYLNIAAMLLVLVALVHLVNQVIGLLPAVADAPLTLERIFGWFMAPLAWLMGVPWAEAQTAGSLLGTKTVLNEFLAYLRLADLPAGELSDRSRLIMTYALCGFANFGSLGIMIGGMSTLAPERRQEIVGLGLRSIAGGTLATCCTGSIVGLIATVG